MTHVPVSVCVCVCVWQWVWLTLTREEGKDPTDGMDLTDGMDPTDATFKVSPSLPHAHSPRPQLYPTLSKTPRDSGSQCTPSSSRLP